MRNCQRGRRGKGIIMASHRGHGGTEFFRTQRRAGARGEDTEQSRGMEGAESSEETLYLGR